MNLEPHQHSGDCQCYKPSAPPPCAHPHYPPARPAVSAGKVLAAGAAGSLFLAVLSLFAIAVAIGAVAVTVCVLVLYAIYKDVLGRKG
ncbi:hypothetical protein [Streptomyces synnematoformans]|uniref:SpdD protein n=1 Tax=Streptomyces synnematoformans TaxID=415721 RepID=A0ABP5JI64_9ACTN